MHMRHLALPLLLVPGAAAADVTPQEVWDNMVAGYGAFGFEISATLDDSGDILIANDGVVSLTYPIIGGQVTGTLPPMTLTAVGDGTVTIAVPSTYLSTITADVPDTDGQQLSADLTVAQEGHSSVASGSAGDVIYVSEASSFDMLISNVVIPGEDSVVFDLQFDSDGYTSETRVTVTDSVSVTNDTTNRASVTTFNASADGVRQEGTTTSGPLITNLAALIPEGTDILNLAPALRAGLSISGATQAEGGQSETKTFDGDQLVAEQNQITGASKATFGFDADGIRAEGTGGAGSFTMTGDEFGLPFPIEVAFGGAGGKFEFPLLASEDPQGFAYGFSLNDLTIADGLWDLLDAGQALDRSPVSLALDLNGELLNSADLVDPATWEAMDRGVVPIEPVSLNLTDLSLAALGAAVQASGAFTFDNTDLVTFGGVPRPEGKAEASASGLNAAMDQLIAAGFISEEDVMMPRMFMGMFAVAQGDDQLTTELEINAEGHVILNGQRVQ